MALIGLPPPPPLEADRVPLQQKNHSTLIKIKQLRHQLRRCCRWLARRSQNVDTENRILITKQQQTNALLSVQQITI